MKSHASGKLKDGSKCKVVGGFRMWADSHSASTSRTFNWHVQNLQARTSVLGVWS